MFTEADFAAAKAILPSGVLRADDDDDSHCNENRWPSKSLAEVLAILKRDVIQ